MVVRSGSPQVVGCTTGLPSRQCNTGARKVEFVIIPSHFYAQQQLLLQRVLAIAILSVRPSHGWISQKRCKLKSPNLHRRLP